MAIGMANVSQGSSSLGDIKSTIRTDYGDKWLLCNGDRLYSDGDYPALYAITNRGPSGNWDYGTISTSDSARVNGIKYLNGYAITYGYVNVGSDDNNCTIWYKNGNSNTFTEKTIETGQNLYHSLCDIIWTGTYYVTMFVAYNSGSVYLYYSTTLSGTWTLVTTSGSFYNNEAILCYGGGYYSFATRTGSGYPYVKYSTDLSIWSGITLQSASEYILYHAYNNGRWEVITRDTSGYYHLYYSSTINSGWTRMTTSFTGTSGNYKYVSYNDGKYIIGVTNSSKPAIRYSEDFSSWTLQDLSSTTVSDAPSYLTYTGQYWCVKCGNVLMYSDDLYSTSWISINFSELSPDYTSSTTYWGIVYDSIYEDIIIGFPVGLSASNMMCLDRYAQLPLITYDGAYAYIKAE